MGKYNDIWIRVKEYDKAEKERKRKQRAEKRKQLEERRHEMTVPIVEDVSLIDESVRGEDEDTLPLWATTDYRVVKNYVPPVFNPGVPNLKKNGALKKYKDRFSKYLAFIDCVKYYRSTKRIFRRRR